MALIHMADASKCAVCSTPTRSWRYKAIACPACANFFYRCAMNDGKWMRCANAGTMDPRDCFDKFRCRSCRLKVCLAAGMSDEVIRFNAVARKISKEERNASKLADEEIQTIVNNPPSAAVIVDRVMTELLHIESAFNHIRESTFNPIPGNVGSLEVALEGTSKLAGKFEKMEGWPLTLPEDFTFRSESLLENIVMRIEIDIKREHCATNRKWWYFSNTIYAIEYFKTFEVFRQLSSNTRIPYSVYLLPKWRFSVRPSSISPDETEPFGGLEKVFAREFQASTALLDLLKEMDVDEREYVILKLLIILSPSLEDASPYERAILTRHSENYATILFSYVLARRDTAEGPKSYQRMLSIIGTVTQMVEREKGLQLLFGAVRMYHELCPLLEEIILI